MSRVFSCTHLWSRPNSRGQRWCRHCDIEANAWMNLVKQECNRISSYEEHRETVVSFYRCLGKEEEKPAVKQGGFTIQLSLFSK